MGYKTSDPCLKKAFDDEKIFVLMARDATAPLVIMEWIKLNIGIQPVEKLQEAYDCAMEMKETCLDIGQLSKFNREQYHSFKDMYNRIIRQKYKVRPPYCEAVHNGTQTMYCPDQCLKCSKKMFHFDNPKL